MPTFYAHQRFGQCVLRTAAPAVKALCSEYMDLFSIGLQGPDIFAFYKPLHSNPVSAYADRCHRTKGSDFLPQAAATIRSAPDRDAALAYFYGFLCHLALDSECHPYVKEAMKLTGKSHAAVETSLDCFLLLEDRIDPLSYPPKQYINPSEASAALIASFFPPVDKKIVEKSLRSLILYSGILYTKSPWLRQGLKSFLSRNKKLRFISDMLMVEEPFAACALSDRHLKKLSENALSLAHELIAETATYIESEKTVGKCFSRTFSGTLNN